MTTKLPTVAICLSRSFSHHCGVGVASLRGTPVGTISVLPGSKATEMSAPLCKPAIQTRLLPRSGLSRGFFGDVTGTFLWLATRNACNLHKFWCSCRFKAQEPARTHDNDVDSLEHHWGDLPDSKKQLYAQMAAVTRCAFCICHVMRISHDYFKQHTGCDLSLQAIHAGQDGR